MRYLRVLAILGICLVSTSYAHAQRVVVGIGGPAYVGAAPVCAYGYYPYYPYACAPFGYYGPSWFSGGFFIGAGPWFHGFGHPGFVGRPGFFGRPGFRGPASFGRGPVGGGFHGSAGFHGNSAVHAGGGGGFHGGGGSHGGGHR
jgi:hypothetical protein